MSHAGRKHLLGEGGAGRDLADRGDPAVRSPPSLSSRGDVVTELNSTQRDFIDWAADPRPTTEKGTQQWFADKHKVTSESCRRWKKTDWFREELEERMRDMSLGTDSIMAVIAAQQQRAVEGDNQAAKTYLALLERVAPMRQQVDDGDLSGVSTADLLAMLDGAVE